MCVTSLDCTVHAVLVIAYTELLSFHGRGNHPTLHARTLSQCQPAAQARPFSSVHLPAWEYLLTCEIRARINFTPSSYVLFYTATSNHPIFWPMSIKPTFVWSTSDRRDVFHTLLLPSLMHLGNWHGSKLTSSCAKRMAFLLVLLFARICMAHPDREVVQPATVPRKSCWGLIMERKRTKQFAVYFN